MAYWPIYFPRSICFRNPFYERTLRARRSVPNLFSTKQIVVSSFPESCPTNHYYVDPYIFVRVFHSKLGSFSPPI